MILSQHAKRVLTADYMPDGYLQLVAVRPDEDPNKIQVKVIRLNTEDQSRLVEMIIAQQRKLEDVCPGDPHANIAPHGFVYRGDCDSCSVCGRERQGK